MTALERRQPEADVALGLPIRTLEQAITLAKNLALANLMPKSLQGKAPDVLAILLYGQDLGLSPMQAVQGIYVVNGRPSLASQTWLALARKQGHRVEVKEHTAERCTVIVERGDTGERHTSTFEIGDAQKAGLLGKDVWKQYPRNMLLARAVSNAMRFIAPEIALGFYTPDEVEEIAEREAVEAQRVDVQAPSEKDGVRRPEDVAAEVEALEGEFVDEPSRRDARRAISAGHEIDMIPSTSLTTDDAWRWLCDTCRPGEDDASVPMSYEDALADHAHFAATVGGGA